MNGSWGTLSLDWGTPDPTEADYMSLISANHDGAETLFTYEGSCYFTGGSTSYPIGVRVKEITVRDNASTVVRKRSFTYGEDMFDGHFYPMPEDYTTVSATESVTGLNTLTYTWSFSVHETPVTDGPGLLDARVVYGTVTEEETDGTATNGAKTVYTFNTVDMHPSGTSTISRFPSGWYDEYTSNTYAPTAIAPLSGVRSGYEESGPRGPALLTRKDIYAWNGASHQLVERENYTYNSPTCYNVLVDYKVTQVMVHSAYGEIGNLQFGDMYHYPVYAKDYHVKRPRSIIKIGYHSNGNDTTAVEMSYYGGGSDMSIPSRLATVQTDIDQNVRTIQYTYPDTYQNAPAWVSSLVSAHRLNVVLKQELYHGFLELVPFPGWRGEGSGGTRLPGTIGTLWKEETTTYDSYIINNHSYLLPSLRIEKTNGVESWRETIESRDKLGNVQSVKERGRPETVIFWGYGGRYPVAIIENASYEDVYLYLGRAFMIGYNPSSTPTSSQITNFNGLRSDLPDAHVTVMEWVPGFGIASMTNPSGVKTTWSYDNAGRLQYVKDANNKNLEEYVYSLYNNGGNGRLSMKRKLYRTNNGNVSADDVRWWNTLGMRLEDIAIKGSGDSQKSLVTAYESDYLLHDDVKTWLPYPVTATTGSFVSGAASASATYHSDSKAYSHKGYEQSSRDFVKTTAVPGFEGVHNNQESIESVSGFPKLIWTDGVGIEGANETYRNRNIVEKRSVDADGRRQSQFVHPEGWLLATSWGSATPASTDPAPTYYVYDLYDRLRAVVGSGIALTDTLNMWRYSYDALDRMSSKGIPGSEREFYTYDSEDNVTSIRQGDELREMEYNDFGQVTKVYLKKGTATRVLMEEHEYGNGGLETWSSIAEVDGDGTVTGYAETDYTYDSKARLISAVTDDTLGGTLQESYTYNFPGDVTNHTTSYTHGNVTDALSITYDYDLRGRMVESVSTLSLGGSTSSSVTTEYSYDALGRPSGQTSTASGTGGTLNKITVTDGYTLQGWLSSHQVKKGTQTLFTESLKYNSPSSSSGGNALYSGLISERSDQWKFTNFGQGVTTTDGYQYDNAGRLTYVKRGSTVGTLSYDARGNVLTAEGDSYTYSGDHVATFTPSGQSAVYFTHDSRGRMTYDGVGGVTIDYNYLNLPRKISGTGGTLAKYSYLANGSKTEAEDGSGAGLVYRGSLIYKKASNGTLTFDGASIPEGRLLSGAT
ncbi:MAG: RHS repeat protein, partial [Bacteroidales bacterium]|nr:RHS repeat protein [Bacteroidales bacterium]